MSYRLANSLYTAFGTLGFINMKCAKKLAVLIMLVTTLSVSCSACSGIGHTADDEYQALFKERFAEARKVGLHYTAMNCWPKDSAPAFSEGVGDYYKCEHYKSPDELRAATAAVFSGELAQGFFTRFEYNAFIEREGSLYITPWYLFDVSPWQAEETISSQGQSVDTFRWDTLTVTKAENAKISYTMDYYYSYPDEPITAAFTLIKGADGIWRFDECFEE